MTRNLYVLISAALFTTDGGVGLEKSHGKFNENNKIILYIRTNCRLLKDRLAHSRYMSSMVVWEMADWKIEHLHVYYIILTVYILIQYQSNKMS